MLRDRRASYTFIPEIEREGVFRLVEVDTDGNQSEKSTKNKGVNVSNG